RSQLVIARVYRAHRTVSSKVIQPEHTDCNHKGCASMADLEPGNRKHHPRQGRDRTQQANQVSLQQIKAMDRCRRQTKSNTQESADAQAPEIMHQTGLSSRPKTTGFNLLEQSRGQAQWIRQRTARSPAIDISQAPHQDKQGQTGYAVNNPLQTATPQGINQGTRSCGCCGKQTCLFRNAHYGATFS